MARVPYLDPEQLDEPAKGLVAGHPINLYRALAHAPDALQHLSDVGMWIRHDSSLDPRLREIAILSVGVLRDNAYEFSHHHKIGLDAGLSTEDIRTVVAMLKEARLPHASPEQVVVQMAKEISDSALSQHTWDMATEVFDVKTVLELIVVIAYYNGMVRILESLKIDVEPGYEEFTLDRL